MSFIEKMIASEAWIATHIDTLDTVVEIKKLTVREGAKFDKKIKSVNLEKNPGAIADVIYVAGQEFIRDEDTGFMIFEDVDIDTVRDMPVDVCAEVFKKFREINSVETDQETEKN